MRDAASEVFDFVNEQKPGLYGAYTAMFKSDDNRFPVLEFTNTFWLMRGPVFSKTRGLLVCNHRLGVRRHTKGRALA